MFQGQTPHVSDSLNLMALFVPDYFSYMNKIQPFLWCHIQHTVRELFSYMLFPTHSISKLKLHKPPACLTKNQRSVYCNSTNIYNKIPDDLAELVSNKKCFLLQLKKYLIDNPFYSVEDF